MKTELIGKTFSYSLKIGGVLMVVTITGFEKAGDRFLSDSYTGKKTMIFKNGETMTGEYACSAKEFEAKKRRGEMKVLR